MITQEQADQKEKLLEILFSIQEAQCELEKQGFTLAEIVKLFDKFNGNLDSISNHLIAQSANSQQCNSKPKENFVSLDDEICYKSVFCSLVLCSKFEEYGHPNFIHISNYISCFLLALHQHSNNTTQLQQNSGYFDLDKTVETVVGVSSYLRMGIDKIIPGSSIGLSVINGASSLYRRKAFSDFTFGLERGWGPEQFRLLESSIEENCIRLTCIRHAMSHSEDPLLGGSYMNFDSNLNEMGIEQAAQLGKLLRKKGLLSKENQLLILSPFSRSIQTATSIFGKSEWRRPYTIITPLCSDHYYYNRSQFIHGDKGSTVEQLNNKFYSFDHPQFNNFEEVKKYENKVKSDWWVHGNESGYETIESFKERTKLFLNFLIEECKKKKYNNVIIISHSDFLTELFGDVFSSCEFKCYNLNITDSTISKCKKEIIIESRNLLKFSSITILSPIYSTDALFEIIGTVKNFKFKSNLTLSTLRDKVHTRVLEILGREKYNLLFPMKFPHNSIIFSTSLSPWLMNLSNLIESDKDFPKELIEELIDYFMSFKVEEIINTNNNNNNV